MLSHIKTILLLLEYGFFNKLKIYFYMDINSQKKFEDKSIASSGQTREILPIINNKGDFIEVCGKDAVIALIKNLLMTPLGSYPFDPEYGSLLYKQLFELYNDTTESQIYYEVTDRIEKYVDGIKVDSVNITWKVKNKTCYVDVYISILNDKDKTKLSLFMQNYGESMYGSIDDPVFGDFKF